MILGEKLGEKMPERLSCSTVDGGMSVVGDPKNEKNKVVRFYHKPSDVSATRMYITPVGSKNPTCHVLAFDMYVESAVDSSTSFQIHVSDYLFTMGFVNGKVKLGDASSTNSKVSIYNGFGEAFSFGEWHNVRIEFYTDIGDGTCRSKIYVDNILVGISDNFEGKEVAGAKHTTDFQLATIYALIKTDESVLFDNIECFKDTLEYTEGEIGEKN